MTRIFVSQYDPNTGDSTWLEKDHDDIEDVSWIGCSGYVDMLLDMERNEAYHRAITETIHSMPDKNHSVRVLDIGTGTGLLSIMASKCDARRVQEVHAMELFAPMAKIAKRTICENACDVRVHEMRSTDANESTIGGRANVLVSEILDSFLVGEGLLPSVLHARQELLTENAKMVPKGARVYVRAFESDALFELFCPKLIQSWIGECRGTDAIEVPIFAWRNDVKWLSEPVEVLEFDLERLTEDQCHGMKSQMIKCLPGTCHGLLLYWELQLSDSVVLSTSPWEDAEGSVWKTNQQRRHWQQVVHFFSNTANINSAQNSFELDLDIFHNDFKIWFGTNSNPTFTRSPVCTCLFHTLFAPHELACLFSSQVSSFISRSLPVTKTIVVDTDPIPLTRLLCQPLPPYKLLHQPSSQSPSSTKLSLKLNRFFSTSASSTYYSPTSPTPKDDMALSILSYDFFTYRHIFYPSLILPPHQSTRFPAALIFTSLLSAFHLHHGRFATFAVSSWPILTNSLKNMSMSTRHVECL